SDVLGYSPDSSLKYADNAVYFKNTDFGKYFDCFKNLPDDTLMCIMDKHVLSEEEDLLAAKDLFVKIMEFEGYIKALAHASAFGSPKGNCSTSLSRRGCKQ
ncbi:MAG: hypothetical protein J6R88_05815, partial [Clostridia bacterium]|nr:hypothetical protein [Clostridia bacterium]